MNNKGYLLRDSEVSKIIGISPQTLRKARIEKRGIPYIQFGHSIRYDPKDVMDYIDSCRKRFEPTGYEEEGVDEKDQPERDS